MHLKCRECRENPLSVYPRSKYKPLDPPVQRHSCKRTSRFRRGAQLRPNGRHGMIQAYDRAFRFPRTLAHRAAEPGRGAVAAAAVGGSVAGEGARLSGGLHLFCRARVLPARRPAAASRRARRGIRSEEHTSELQSPCNLVCRLLLEKKKERVAMDRTDPPD